MMNIDLAPPRLRGGLTRWLTEIAPGVYVGNVNASVREYLWELAVDEAHMTGRVVMVYKTNNEQGYAIQMHGVSSRKVVELDGLQLVANKHASWRDWMEDEEELAENE